MLRKFIKDIAKYSLSQLLPALTAFITTPILTRLFPPADYGNWALALSVVSFLVALAVSGIGSAVIRYYPAYKVNSTLNTFFATIIISVGAITAIIAGAGFLILFIFKDYFPPALTEFLPLIILIFILVSTFTVFMAVLRVQERSGAYTAFQLIFNYGGLGAGLLLVLGFGFRIDGLLWGTILTLVLLIPVLVFRATKGVGVHLGSFKLPDALHILEYAWPLTLGSVAMWGLRLSDLFIIIFFNTERDVGLYTVSYNISSKSIELLVTLFLLSVSPLLMNTWEHEGQAATEKTLTMVTRVYLIVCLPATVGLSVLAYPFIALLTSPEYYGGYKIFGVVALSSFVWGLANIAQMGLAIKKNTRRLGANQILGASIHIGLAIILVPKFGYAAAAITTLIGYTALLLLQTLASRPHLTWHFPFSTLRNVLAASAVMGLTSYWIYGFSGNRSEGSLTYLILSVLVSIPVYFLLLWLFGEISKKEKDIVLQLRGSFANKKG